MSILKCNSNPSKDSKFSENLLFNHNINIYTNKIIQGKRNSVNQQQFNQKYFIQNFDINHTLSNIKNTEKNKFQVPKIVPLSLSEINGKLQSMARHIQQPVQQNQSLNQQIPVTKLTEVNSQSPLKFKVQKSIQRQNKSMKSSKSTTFDKKLTTLFHKSLRNSVYQERQRVTEPRSIIMNQISRIKVYKQFQNKTLKQIQNTEKKQNNHRKNNLKNYQDNLFNKSKNKLQQVQKQQNKQINDQKCFTPGKIRQRKSSLILTNDKTIFTTIQKKNFFSPNMNDILKHQKIISFKQFQKIQNEVSLNQIKRINENADEIKDKVLIPKFIKIREIRNQCIKNTINYIDNLNVNKNQINLKQNLKRFTINNFQIKQKLGKGAYGDAFLAQQKQIGFICVLKKLSKKKIKQSNLQQQILRQIKIQSSLCHKHITNLYGIFDDQNYLYLILQYLNDGSLVQRFGRKKCSQNLTSVFIKQISQALKYMHIQNIIHRDLKTQNIFVLDNYVKIGDFGCAVSSNTSRNTVIGSLAYLSPQQLNNQSYTDKIDIWSLGVICYELITGKTPFQQDIKKIVCNQKQAKLSELKFPQNLQISQEAKDFIFKLLQQNPENRITINQILKHPFTKKAENQDFFKAVG